jgi:hypothetical protein
MLTIRSLNEDPHQQGHVAQLDNDKCQSDTTFQVCANHKSE